MRIALPSGKSLEARTIELFTQARIRMERTDIAHRIVFPDIGPPTTGRFLKPRRIPYLVAERGFDIGITGMDAVIESGADVEVLAELSYSRSTSMKTRCVLFGHEQEYKIGSIKELPEDAVILSEYPNSTRKALAEHNVTATIIASPGSAEAEVPALYRFGVALTETGRSLKENRLKVIATLFESSTVLIANKKTLDSRHAREDIRSLVLLLQGTLRSRDTSLLTMNVPSERLAQVTAILPSLKNPTVSPLIGDTHFSVSTVVQDEQVNGLVMKLLQLGAEDLILCPLTMVIPK